jgi:SAM-dependent methyltransferase
MSTEGNYYEGCNQWLLRAVPAESERILEVGCGAGRLGAALKELRPGRVVFGVDREPGPATEAGRRLDGVFCIDVPGADPIVDDDPFDAETARRALELEEEVAEIDAVLKPMVEETAPALAAMSGVGTEVASALLVAAGDNHERLRNEASFAHLCGTSPIEASSGKHDPTPTQPGRRPPGQLRALARRHHQDGLRPRTQHYIERRMKEGQTKKEAIRCLKRYIAREVYNHLPMDRLALDSP